jgi:hypothetical protein
MLMGRRTDLTFCSLSGVPQRSLLSLTSFELIKTSFNAAALLPFVSLETQPRAQEGNGAYLSQGVDKFNRQIVHLLQRDKDCSGMLF